MTNHKNNVGFIKSTNSDKVSFGGNTGLLSILGNSWTINDASEGVQIFGGTGSGKTSGSGQYLAKTYLYHKFGGLVLTVKTGDCLMWQKYVSDEKIARKGDLIIVDGSEDYKFNFLDYLVKNGYSTINISHVFLTALQKSNDSDYWQNAMEQLLKNTINLLVTAKGSLTISDMYKAVINAPKNKEEALEIANCNNTDSYFGKIFRLAMDCKNPKLRDEFQNLTKHYWLNEFPEMDADPRSSIINMFTSLADNLLRGEIKSVLSCEPEEANFSPEDTFDGKVIILDLPIKKFRKSGKMAQLIFKTVFQMAVESKREDEENKDQMRPIFLWIDEAQFFLTSDDVLFQTTARSCKVCSVYLTQNYSNYIAFVASSREKATVDSFLAVLQTKFFHCQSDPVTNNDYFSQLIGKEYITRESENQTRSLENTKSLTSSKTLDYKILPWKLDQLKKGGLQNDFEVEAIVYQSGRTWKDTDTNYGVVSFRQV